jgi:lycopene cyclase domain-containing protein
MGEYTAAALAAPVLVVLAELAVFRTGLLKQPRYWIALGIVMAFQIPVDGWLTRLEAPIVVYSPEAVSGVRWPWDIPVEDFGFGYAMVTFTLLMWVRATRRAGSTRRDRTPVEAGSDAERD